MRRRAMSPRRAPDPRSLQPADDGNYRVMVRIAHEALAELGTHEPSADVSERVKDLCARRRIDYGRDVPKDVVARAVASAAVAAQRKRPLGR